MRTGGGGRSNRAYWRPLAYVLLAASLAACASTGGGGGPVQPLAGPGVRAYNRPYEVNGRWYRPAEQPGYDAVGVASWYSYPARSRTTADGEMFDAALATAAHTTLPIPSYLEVTNLENGRRVRVRLNDRGPFVAGRLIDVSRAAAEELGFLAQGTARVRVRYIGPAPVSPTMERPILARVSSRPDAALPILPSPPIIESPQKRMPAASSSGFAVQVGAFADRARAEAVAARLAGADIRVLDRDGTTLYRVVLGPWASADAAAPARAEAQASGFPDARIVRLD